MMIMNYTWRLNYHRMNLEKKKKCKYSLDKINYYSSRKSYNKKNEPLSYQDWISKRIHMKCLSCNKKQPIAETCNNCGTNLGKYFCDICKLNNNTKGIKHCDKCNFCVKSNKKHCNACNTCHSSILKTECIKDKNKLNDSCVVCQMALSEPSSLGDGKTNYRYKMHKCKNIFHYNCFVELVSHGGKKCPLCREPI